MTPGWLLALAAAGIVIGMLGAFGARRAWLAATLLGAVAALAAAIWVWRAANLDWRPAFALGGEPIHLQLDGISAFFRAAGGAAARCMPRNIGRTQLTGLGSRRAQERVLREHGPHRVNGLHFLVAWEIHCLRVFPCHPRAAPS
jgi:hydrogenase-4 component B